MKSKNHLTITGVISTEVSVAPDHSWGRFTLVHSYGGHTPALFLSCLIPPQILDGVLATGLKKNDAVTIKAYIRPRGTSVEAVSKAIEIGK
ncbi:MAG: hypothetical protein IKH49_05545 [Bacteroidales bacterium]|nr:hypothetical protein [Bacteroidales bacterium]